MKTRWLFPYAVLAFVLPFASGACAEEIFVQEEIRLDALGIEATAEAGSCPPERKDVNLVFPYCIPLNGCAGGAVAEASTGSMEEGRDISVPAGVLCILLLPLACVFLIRKISTKRTR